MRLFSPIFLLAVPATVFACEGDCIVGITNAFLSNYTVPIDYTMKNMANQIAALIPDGPSGETAYGMLSPILSAYHDQAYDHMEKAIFPNYFHGKCHDSNGVEPAGCPNPDCPVVCGTPGSLVHFYHQLRFIAFNATYHLLQALSTPGTPTYKEVERRVMDSSNQRRHSVVSSRLFSPSRLFSRDFLEGLNVGHNNAAEGFNAPAASSESVPVPGSIPASDSVPAPPLASGSASDYSAPSTHTGFMSGFSKAFASPSRMSISKAPASLPLIGKRTQDIQSGLRSIMEQTRSLLEETCGGSGEDATNGLPHCSWEEAMKQYILSFP